MLQLTDVKKSYHGRLVLNIPNLQLDSGIYWLQGPNGSGKTTLLKMVAGLLPFEGDISFNRTSLRRQPVAYRQAMSWAEAEPLFPNFLTGMEIISLYQDIRNVPLSDVERLLEVFDMRSYVDSAIGTYSAGMTKKLSLLLAFLGDPALIVLDEPLITLDEDSLAALCRLVGERFASAETLFLMSSHQEADQRLLPAGKELFVRDQTIFN